MHIILVHRNSAVLNTQSSRQISALSSSVMMLWGEKLHIDNVLKKKSKSYYFTTTIIKKSFLLNYGIKKVTADENLA